MSAGLTALLRRRIAREGPLAVADYMTEALLHPRFGYYTTGQPFGAAGDFVTAPEISQMFGELIGAWSAASWHQMGAPKRFALIEIGPGRGTLMADLLRAARRAPGFLAAAELHLVEPSPALRERQREALAGQAVAWHDDLADLPALPSILIANEFFDALPIRQLQRAAAGWIERRIGFDDAAGKLTWGLDPGPSPLAALIPPGLAATARPGDIFEFSPAARVAMKTLAAHLATHGGYGLFVDYGHAMPGFGDTFQAVRRHGFADPLEAPGTADLTAHVDFAALLAVAREAGAAVYGPLGQGDLLVALGIRERAASLMVNASERQRRDIESAARRLIAPDEMGTLFKAIAVAAPAAPPPPAFYGRG